MVRLEITKSSSISRKLSGVPLSLLRSGKVRLGAKRIIGTTVISDAVAIANVQLLRDYVTAGMLEVKFLPSTSQRFKALWQPVLMVNKSSVTQEGGAPVVEDKAPPVLQEEAASKPVEQEEADAPAAAPVAVPEEPSIPPAAAEDNEAVAPPAPSEDSVEENAEERPVIQPVHVPLRQRPLRPLRPQGPK